MVMFDELRSAVASLEAVLRDFEPGVLDARHAVRAVKLFARVEHLGAAGKALAVGRVGATRAYRESGARSAGYWLANTTGVPVASAFRALEHGGRELRRWVDPDSAPCGMYRMAPDKGAEIDLIIREARATGGSESRDAYAAALHALVTRGPRKATSATLVCDESPMYATSPRSSVATRAAASLARSRASGRSPSRSLGRCSPMPRCAPSRATARCSPSTRATAAIGHSGSTTGSSSGTRCAANPTATPTSISRPTMCLRSPTVATPSSTTSGGSAGTTIVLKHDRGWEVEGAPHQWKLVPPGLPDAPDDPDPP